MEPYFFLPHYIEIHGELYFSFPDGRLVKVPDEESETIKSTEFYSSDSIDERYLLYAWYDTLNPIVDRECKCGNKVMRRVIMQKRNIYVCECSAYVISDVISI